MYLTWHELRIGIWQFWFQDLQILWEYYYAYTMSHLPLIQLCTLHFDLSIRLYEGGRRERNKSPNTQATLNWIYTSPLSLCCHSTFPSHRGRHLKAKEKGDSRRERSVKGVVLHPDSLLLPFQMLNIFLYSKIKRKLPKCRFNINEHH